MDNIICSSHANRDKALVQSTCTTMLECFTNTITRKPILAYPYMQSSKDSIGHIYQWSNFSGCQQLHNASYKWPEPSYKSSLKSFGPMVQWALLRSTTPLPRDDNLGERWRQPFPGPAPIVELSSVRVTLGSRYIRKEERGMLIIQKTGFLLDASTSVSQYDHIWNHLRQRHPRTALFLWGPYGSNWKHTNKPTLRRMLNESGTRFGTRFNDAD